MAGLTVGGRSVCEPMRPRVRCGRPAEVAAPSWATFGGGLPVRHEGRWWRVELVERAGSWVGEARTAGLSWTLVTHPAVSEADAWASMLRRIRETAVLLCG